MVWRKTKEMLSANPNFSSPPYFFGIVTDLYATSQATAVRREVEGRGLRDRNTCRLLHELRLAAPTITRGWYRSIYPDDPFMQAMANNAFDRFSLGGDTLATDWVDFASTWLRAVSLRIREYVDKRIAHPDHASEIVIPTFSDLDAAVDALGEVDRQIHLLLRAADYDGPEPYVQFNWAAGLEMPWYVPAARQN
jgi:hypothetical protein